MRGRRRRPLPVRAQMLRNLLHFGDHTAGDICVTRGDIIAVPSTISFDASSAPSSMLATAACRCIGDSLDEVMGMVHIKDVFMASVDPSATGR